jgi:two-component system response regulator PilR (NtrC family)
LRPSSGLKREIPTDLPPEGLDLEHLINGLERDFLVKALARTGGIKKQAARLLRLNSRSFRYRLDKYGIKRVSDSEEEPDQDEDTEA